VTEMDVREAIGQIDAAEDLFALLDVAFDPAVLAVHRIAILKRFGEELAVLERRQPPLSEGERPLLYAVALLRTHELYARGGSDVEPLFRPRPRNVVAVERLRRAISSVNVT
jgi:hypothetical protein